MRDPFSSRSLVSVGEVPAVAIVGGSWIARTSATGMRSPRRAPITRELRRVQRGWL
jgi:hypothetical protein